MYFNVPLSENFKAEHFVRTPQTVHNTPALLLHVKPETRLRVALVLRNILQTLQENSGNVPQIRKDRLVHHPFTFTHQLTFILPFGTTYTYRIKVSLNKRTTCMFLRRYEGYGPLRRDEV